MTQFTGFSQRARQMACFTPVLPRTGTAFHRRYVLCLGSWWGKEVMERDKIKEVNKPSKKQ
jgi:hypothetical protein